MIDLKDLNKDKIVAVVKQEVLVESLAGENLIKLLQIHAHIDNVQKDSKPSSFFAAVGDSGKVYVYNEKEFDSFDKASESAKEYDNYIITVGKPIKETEGLAMDNPEIFSVWVPADIPESISKVLAR